ncbi:MAG: mannose-1-phosphate guanylyltransferase [Syntrophomonadaceae bacterium]
MMSVILAGGKGLRLWPESRQHRPKQLCKFFNNRSMLNNTIERLLRSGSTNIYVVTNDELRPHIEAETRCYADKAVIEVMCEPQGKNTAPAVGLILARLYQENQEDILGVFPADHFVGNEEAFAKSLDKAVQAAEKHHLVTIGIEPQSPETGYGYIEKTRWEVGEIPDVFQVNSFCEKPDLQKAKDYLEGGCHLWNAGIYVGHSSTFLEEFARHLPEIYQHIIKGASEYVEAYNRLPDVSLDYGIAEKSDRIAVVPSSFDWCDLGNWNALADFFNSDNENNTLVRGDAAFIKSKNCLVQQKEKCLVLFGVDNLLVVESDDIIMIADRSLSQDIRELTEALVQKQRHYLL